MLRGEDLDSLSFVRKFPYINMVVACVLVTLAVLALFVATTFWPALALLVVAFSRILVFSTYKNEGILAGAYALAVPFMALANPYIFVKLALLGIVFAFFSVFGETWEKAAKDFERPVFGELVMCGILMSLMAATTQMITLGAANYWHDNYDERTPLYRLEDLPSYAIKMPPAGSYSYNK